MGRFLDVRNDWDEDMRRGDRRRQAKAQRKHGQAERGRRSFNDDDFDPDTFVNPNTFIIQTQRDYR